MSGRKDSIDLWLAALQERLNEDVRSKLPTLDKEDLAVKLNELLHQVRGPSEVPFGMKVYRLELSVTRRQPKNNNNHHHHHNNSGGGSSSSSWMMESSPKVADFFELRVVNARYDVILSMEARMDDPTAMRRLFQFVASTRTSVLSLKFTQGIYTGKLRRPLLLALEQRGLRCVEVYGTTLPDILLEFLTNVSKNQRKCYFTSLSILGEAGSDEYHTTTTTTTINGNDEKSDDDDEKSDDDDDTSLSLQAAQRIAEMLLHFKLTVLTLEHVSIKDDAVAASLADAIQRCESLESLNLTSGMKGMANVSVQQIIGQGIAHNESLKKLRLSA